jgi:S-adenosylmethionine:tRNA ribosyltransferase-isomerase
MTVTGHGGTTPSRSDLMYDLPPGLIAQEPLDTRSDSRLLVARRGPEILEERTFRDLPSLLDPGDLLVMNDTKIFRARLRGVKRATGGKVELFLLSSTDEDRWKVLVRPSKRVRAGTALDFPGGLEAVVEEMLGGGRASVAFSSAGGDTAELIRVAGEVPLPPYIRRTPDELDAERYQTVYASVTGAVAAPTAGLHFDEEVLEGLAGRGVATGMITLHVGPGTFLPLRFDELGRNRLDPEWYRVPAETAGKIMATRRRGGRIIAVGTTSVRVLESIDPEADVTQEGETDLFIYPPWEFGQVDGMVTNFHLPGSSLLALVAAFMGTGFMKRAYGMAVDSGFRFYSYGDAMLIV